MDRPAAIVLLLSLAACGGGRPDILTLAQYASSQDRREGRLIVHLQTSPGSFSTVQTAVVGTYPWRFAVGEIDGDGAPDVAVADVDARGVWVLLQDPGNRGRFRGPQQVAEDLTPQGVAIADLNGDGRADLALGVALPRSGYTPNTVIGTSLQQPDGSLGPVATAVPQQGFNLARLTIADYEGDGRKDVFAYFTPYSTDYTAKLTVLRQGPAGGFVGPVDTRLGEVKGLDDAVFADLDGDGRPDAALVGFFPVGSPSVVQSRLNRFTQSGAGGFALVSSASLPFSASRLAAGDVDGDGRSEVVVLGAEDRFEVPGLTY